MAKPLPELMVSVQEIGGFPAGTRLHEDDQLVKAHPRMFVPFSEGDRAVYRRRVELVQEQEAKRASQLANSLAEAIKVGTRPLASDDALGEAAKYAVRNDNRLELVYDDAGTILGARPKNKSQSVVVSPVSGRYVEE